MYLCCKYSKDPEFTEPGQTVRFYKYSHVAFTFGPFSTSFRPARFSQTSDQYHHQFGLYRPFYFPCPSLWEICLLLSRNSCWYVALSYDLCCNELRRSSQAMCKIEDSLSNTLSLALMLSALAFSTVISITLVCYLLRAVKLPLSSQCLGRFDIIQLINFAILLAVYVFSIISYSILSATWIRWSDRGHPEGSHSSPIFRISVIWQCKHSSSVEYTVSLIKL